MIKCRIYIIKLLYKQKMRSNTKKVSQAVQKHILDYYKEEGVEGFVHDVEAVKYGNMTDAEAIRAWVQCGMPLAYNEDIVNFLNGLGINPENKEYPIQQSIDLYYNLIVREGLKILNNFSNK